MKRVVLAVGLSTVVISSMSYSSDKDHHDHKKRHHKAHNHGSGEFSLVASGSELMIELKIPGHDVVGFEHKPKSQIQKNKVKDAILFLKKTNLNLKVSKAAKCKSKGDGHVETELTEDAHGDEHHEHEVRGDVHSEFHVRYQFVCQSMGKLKSVSVLSFKEFKKMKRLKAQGVTESGQYSGVLTPRSPEFNLNQ